MVFSLLLSFIFFLLSGIHFYWTLGGQFGFTASLPTNEKGESVLHPKKADCIVVGLGLFAFGFFYVLKLALLPIHLPTWVFQYGGWIIPSIFTLRAIGDFKYLGFFKQIRTTQFGKLDTYFFAPLCLIIGVFGFIIQLLY